MKECWGIVLSVFALVLLSPNALAVKNVNSQSALQEAIDDNETEIIVTDNFSLSDSISIPDNTEVTIKSDENGPYTITKSTTGRFFSVEGNLTLEQITLDGNYDSDSGSTNSSSGGVVVTTGGNFTMNSGAVITKCYNYDGGGVYLSGENSSFTMNSGSVIENCTGYYGGGVDTFGDTNSKVMIDGGTIRGNTATSGGGIYINRPATLNMISGEISGNTASSGGGLFFYAGDSTISGGEISGNTAQDGGGITIFDDGTVTMTAGKISGNTASNSKTYGLGGGVLVLENSTFNIQGGLISDNTVSSDIYFGLGGGVCAHTTSKVTMNGGEIKGNNAQWGAGVCLYNGIMDMIGGEISGNKAGTKNNCAGGGIFLNASTETALTISNNAVISGNEAYRGGGIYLGENSTMSISESEISNNTAYFNGGGVYSMASTFNLTETTVKGNISQNGNGGGLALYNDTANFYSGEISGNKAEKGNGGGIYADKSLKSFNVGMSGDVELSGNTAVNGGGTYIDKYIGSFNWVNTVSADNTATENGGGVYLDLKYMEYMFMDSAFTGNTAEKGGGLYVMRDDTYSGMGVNGAALVFDGNQARYGGAIYLTKDATLSLRFMEDDDELTIVSKLTGNTATSEGGGIFTENYTTGYQVTNEDYSNIFTEDTTVFSGNKANGLYNPPENAGEWYENIKFASVSAENLLSVKHPINNFDINYVGTDSVLYYTFTYHSNFDTDVAVETGTYAPSDTCTVLNYMAVSGLPSRDGYTFLGWATSENGNVVYASADCEKGEASFTVLQNTDLYAVWQENKVDPEPTPTYTVTYDGNESTSGSMTDLNSPYTANTTVKILDNAFKRSGYTFKGFIIKDAYGKVYASASDDIKDSLQSFTITSNVTLVAQWTKNSSGGGGGGGSTTYTVTYNANGGTGSHSDGGLSSGATYTVKSQSATGIARDKYTFTGWNTKADGTGTTYAAADTFKITGNVTLYAQWKSSGDDSLLNTEDHMAYVIGYTDGTVKPAANITRAEVATIYFRFLTENARNSYWSTSNTYSDVNGENWFNNAVSTMSNANIITGYTDGTFGGNRNITRAEFAAIAARFDSSNYTGSDKFSDISGHWAAEYINRAAEKGWITGYEDGTFKPNQYITRAEAMTLINRVLGRDNIAGMHTDMKTWSDNPSTAWYYEAVQEATNSHEYTRESTTNAETWTKVTETPDWAALEKSWSTANSI